MGKTVCGHVKGNQNNFNFYYNKEEDGVRVGRGELRQEEREEGGRGTEAGRGGELEKTRIRYN